MDRSNASVLLWRTDPRRGRVVVAVCGRCRAAGAGVAMPLAQAVELARPDVVECHDPGGDAAALEKLAETLSETVSPMVAVEELDDAPWAGHWRHQSESILVDVTGIAALVGGEASLADLAAAAVRRHRLVAQIAIADTPAAAWAAAHYRLTDAAGIDGRSGNNGKNSAEGRPGSHSSPSSQTSHSHYTHSHPPATILPPGHGVAPLCPLPIESLRLPVATVETLGRLGVETLGELLRLPREGLASRLGKDLIRRLDQITGDRYEPVTIHAAPPQYSADHDLEYATGDHAILIDRLGGLIRRVTAAMEPDGRGALRISVRMDHQRRLPTLIDVGLFAPSRDVDHLTQLLSHRLETLELVDENDDVVRLTLSVVLAAATRTRQPALFDTGVRRISDRAWRTDHWIARLVDTLAMRLGRRGVVRWITGNDPRPESAFEAVPLTGNVDDESAAESRPGRRSFAPGRHDAMRRPLMLSTRPRAVMASVADPPRFCTTIPAGRLPAAVRIDGVVHRVQRTWGPERIETDWWRDQSVARDYYRVQTHRGAWWWMFHDRGDAEETRWYIHGEFG